MFGPSGNSGFDGIVAAPVYRPIFGLASCFRGAGKLLRPMTCVWRLVASVERFRPLAVSEAPATIAAPEADVRPPAVKPAVERYTLTPLSSRSIARATPRAESVLNA